MCSWTIDMTNVEFKTLQVYFYDSTICKVTNGGTKIAFYSISLCFCYFHS